MAEREYNAHVEDEKQKAVHNKAVEIAKNLLKAGGASKIVSTSLGLSLSEVQMCEIEPAIFSLIFE